MLLTKPFGKIIESEESTIILDAVYIPVLKERPIPITDFNWLLQYSKEIVVLFSEGCADWAIGLGNRFRIEEIKNNAFCEKYLKREENRNPSVKLRPNFDIPVKRSYALFDAQNRNYEYVLFLDDDIKMSEDNMHTGLSGLAQNNAIVGFHVIDYPDVSTIDHVERIERNCPNLISMTGSCMFLNINKVVGDFPLVYNEDLFFFMKQTNPQEVVSGGTVIQNEYCPWFFSERIRHEQFGDLIYEALKKRFMGIDVTVIEWEKEIQFRLNRIKMLQEDTTQEIMKKALSEAYEATNAIQAEDINNFIANYQFAAWVKDYLL